MAPAATELLELLIHRAISAADRAVSAVHDLLPAGHPCRAALDDVVVRLHDARRAAERTG